MNHDTPHNLFPTSPAFTGRDDDLTRLAEQIDAERVCQLTGPAGIGKTELARSVGHRLRQEGRFPNGVFHITMDDTGRPATLLGELILLLGFDETKGVENALGGTRMLIIWDQLDTTLAMQPERLTALLDDTFGPLPDIHHLIVSRAGLDGVPAQTVGPLDRDAAHGIFAANLPDTVSAEPSADDPALAGALTLLGGNPLAIQVAASWCQPPNWTGDLERALQKQDHENPLERLLGFIYDELSQETIRLLGLLHGFPGGADDETLDSTYGDESEAPLAQARRSGLLPVAVKHHLHPAIRDFVATRLGPLRADAFREQAAVFLHQTIRECRNQVEAGNVAPAMQFLIREWPNLRAAFSWVTNRMDKAGVDLEEDCELILDYCFAFFHLFTNRLMFSEGLRWMEAGRKAAMEMDNPHELALMRDYCGVLNIYLHNNDAGREELEAAIASFRELNEAAGIASTGYHLGLLAYRGGDLDAAREYFEETLPIMRQGNSRAFAAQATTFLGQIYLGQGESQLAHDTLSEALTLYREETLSIDLRLNTLFGLSRAALMLGNEADSLERVNEAVSVAFGVSPRTATAALPNILQMAEVYLSHDGGRHFAAFTESITSLVTKLKTLTPKPEIAKEWAMTCHLMERVARLLTHMVPASGSGDTPENRDELRPAVSAEARELDALSGGILAVEAWINAWLDGAARVGG